MFNFLFERYILYPQILTSILLLFLDRLGYLYDVICRFIFKGEKRKNLIDFIIVFYITISKLVLSIYVNLTSFDRQL